MTAVTVFAVLALLAAFVQLEQHLLRWRAERLLADIRQIQMGKSTWADAQRFMTKWGTWGHYEGSCTAEKCDYSIAMEDAARALTAYIFVGRTEKTVIEPRQCCS